MTPPPTRPEWRMKLGYVLCQHKWSDWWLAPPVPFTPRPTGGPDARWLCRCERCGCEAITDGETYSWILPAQTRLRRAWASARRLARKS